MKILFAFALIITLLYSCKRDDVNYIGPSYVSAGPGFAVTSFSAKPAFINFDTSNVVLNASFNQTVSWSLTMTGKKSGAIHYLSGISNGFSNLQWTGTNDNLPFFRGGEDVNAVLSFFGTPVTATSTINILVPHNYKTDNPDKPITRQFPTFGDFEYPAGVLKNDVWHAFNNPTAIPNVVQGIDSMAVDYNGKVVPSVQGNNYYFIKGKGNTPNFVSGVSYDRGKMMTAQLSANPDSIWVNVYVYGTGDANANVEFLYQEDDIGGKQGYQDLEDDAYVMPIVLSHKGWKLFSFKYSSLNPTPNANFGGSGNKIHEPNRIWSIAVVLSKKTKPDLPVEVYFDFPIITVGGPFDPSK